MITFKLILSNKKAAFLRLLTSWDECTFATYKNIMEATTITDDQERIREFLRCICIMGSENIKLFNHEELIAFDGIISWINNLDLIVPATTPDAIALNVFDAPWANLINCHKAIDANKDNLVMGAPEIVKAYLDLDVMNIPFSQLVGAYMVVTEKVYAFHDHFKMLADTKYKPEEIRAGVLDFSQFGFFGTLSALCKGDVSKYESMLQQKAGTVYSTLVLDKVRAEYQERLNQKSQ